MLVLNNPNLGKQNHAFSDHYLDVDFDLSDVMFIINEGALRHLIRYYTREAGVRNLERELANLAREAVKAIASGKAQKIEITQENLGV